MSEQRPALFNLAANLARAEAAREMLRRHAGCPLLHPEQCNGREPINPKQNPEELAETRRQEHAAWVASLRQIPEAHNSAGTIDARREGGRS